MAAGGCTVRVIARTDTITREFCDTLRAPIQVKIADKPSTTKVGIRGKYLTIAGGFEGETDRRVVWMGSHSLTRNALVRNDETFPAHRRCVPAFGVHDELRCHLVLSVADARMRPGRGTQ